MKYSNDNAKQQKKSSIKNENKKILKSFSDKVMGKSPKSNGKK
jgi:hypothetical protein